MSTPHVDEKAERPEDPFGNGESRRRPLEQQQLAPSAVPHRTARATVRWLLGFLLTTAGALVVSPIADLELPVSAGGPLRYASTIGLLAATVAAWYWTESSWLIWRSPLLAGSVVIALASATGFVVAEVRRVPREAFVVHRFGDGLNSQDVEISRGIVWATDLDRNEVTARSRSDQTFLFSVPIDGAFELAPSSSGVWVSTLEGSLVRVDSDGTVSEEVQLGSAINDIAASGDRVWAALGDEGRIFWVTERLDSSGWVCLFEERAAPCAAEERGIGRPGSISVNSDVIWVTDVEYDQLVAIDPSSGMDVGITGTDGSSYGIFATDEGAWVASGETDTVAFHDVEGRGRPTRVGSRPSDLVLRDGLLWVVYAGTTAPNADTHGGLQAFDVETLQLVFERELQGRPLKLAADSTAVFVALRSGALRIVEGNSPPQAPITTP